VQNIVIPRFFRTLGIAHQIVPTGLLKVIIFVVGEIQRHMFKFTVISMSIFRHLFCADSLKNEDIYGREVSQ
jgi:hypothetical protein